MLIRLLLELIPKDRIELRGIGGETLHGLVLSLMNTQSSELASSLHDSKEAKPLSLSPFTKGIKLRDGKVFLEPERKASFEISFLTDSPAEAFITGLMNGKEPLNLGEKNVSISSVRILNASQFKEIANNTKPRSQIAFRFLSPTSFRSRGEQKVFPEPSLVFSSLFKRWNAFSSIKFPKELEEEFSKIRVTRYSTRTELVEFSNYKIIGFKGTCSYELPKAIPDEAKKQINALADFAFFAGAGYKTTMGMGQTVRL